MKIDMDLTTKLDKLSKEDVNSDIDFSYLKGVVDTFHYVGGTLDENFEKQVGEIWNNVPDSIPSISKLSLETKVNSNHHDLKLEYRSALSQKDKELEYAALKLRDKNEEIEHLQSELKHKNILLSLKDEETSRLTDISKLRNNDILMEKTESIQKKLCITQDKLSDKQNEVNMLRRELEQRNILLSRVDNRLKEMYLL
ncbi:MAG: hypothetical protein DRN27_04290 [Thermoplasmata archaeon]|nr:MAG: hypothetical protein DRN27_04290 [Thermoplasmata archaeon]